LEGFTMSVPKATISIDKLLGGPQRSLPPAEVERETRRLLAVIAAKGVEAVLLDVCTCRELLLSLAEACHQSGLTSAGQYLTYLANPWE
jgi:hypothetical protein